MLSVSFLLANLFVTIESAKAGTITEFQQGESYDIPLTVASRGYYTIDLSSHFGADADLYLYDANNVLVARSVEGGSDSLEGYLNPGNYRMRIYMSFCLSDDCTAYITVRREGRMVTLW
ncbi:MAG: hypothetical protein MUF72_19300 [Elainella sp. Prado103]|nr:hypothetical protein [Elainella sp. Prado103]